LVEGLVGAEAVGNFVIEVDGVVVDCLVGLGFVDVVVADYLIQQNGLLQWRGSRLG
jgi:hypothetical protein